MLEQNVSLRAHQTFGFDVRARLAVRIDAESSLRALHLWLRQGDNSSAYADVPRLVIGGGSNLVMTRDFDGLAILMAIPGKRVVAVTDHQVLIEAGAGENWHAFVEWTLDQGFAGLENLALIPGTVGASPVQNIGAYGLELADRFHSVRAFDIVTGNFQDFDARDCRFGYRDSVFKQPEGTRFVITRVTFALPRPWTPHAAYADLAKALADKNIQVPTARNIFDAVVEVRRAKLPDPAHTGNAGSFFKNPIITHAHYVALRAREAGIVAYALADGRYKLAAGWLIDQCGWKGRALGRAAVHEKQALVLINPGDATGLDVMALADAIRSDVKRRFDVILEVEPLVL